MDLDGRLVGARYRLLGHLGAGGMGTVWRAHDTLLGREVAVKEVTFPPGTRPEEAAVLRERTRREARSAARLSHPNAVTVFDVVEEDGRPWLVMELVEARTLAQAVAEDGPMSPARAARVGLAVLGALEAAHAEGILHRDVKPSNVLLDPARAGQEERAVLTDFGIATSAGDASLTSSGLLLGSPAYISPERASGRSPGPASDLWSLGATLFTAVEGRPPYDNGDPLLTVTAVVAGEHAPYVLAGPLAPVLEGLLEKDPERRLDARRARAQLQAVVDQPERVTRTAPLAPVAVSAQALGAGTAALSLGAVQQEVAEAHRGQHADAVGPATGGDDEVPAAPRRFPEDPGRAATGRRAAVAAAAVVTVAAVSAGVLALTRDDDPPGQRAGAAQPSVAQSAGTPTTSPQQSAAAPSGPTTRAVSPTTVPPATTPPAAAAGTAIAAVPAGWETHTGPPGWVAAIPASYDVRSFGGFPEYRDPRTGRTLRVATGPGQPDAVADRRRQAQSFAATHPTYREIALGSASYRGYEAADWEFTYEGLHVLNRVFVVDGQGYSLFFQTGLADFPAARADLDAIFASFLPAPA